MTVSPLCVVQNGSGSFVGTLNGVNVTAGNVVSIQLADTTDVVDWYLRVFGTDETSASPSLANVNVLDNKVTSPSSTVTFTVPAGAGRAFLLESVVTGPGGPLTTTFGLYVLSTHGFRVAATGEQREGNASFGWAALLNPLVRSGASVIRYVDTVSPSAGSTNVQGALDFLKAQIGGAGGPAGGDLGSNFPNPTVTGLVTIPIIGAPTNGQTLIYNQPSNQFDWGTPGGMLHGDVNGPLQQNKVASFSGVMATQGTPTAGQVLLISANLFLNSLNGVDWDATDSVVWLSDNRLGSTRDRAFISYNPVTDHWHEYPVFPGEGVGLGGIKRTVNDATYVYGIVSDMGANAGVAILNKYTGEIVGYGNLTGTDAQSLILDGLGNLWVVAGDTLFKFVIADMLTSGTTPINASTSLVAFTNAYDVVWDGTYLYVADAPMNTISKVEPSGLGIPLQYTNPSGAGMPALLLFAPGDLWAACGNNIVRVETAGMTQTAFIDFGAPESGFGFDALASDGTLVWGIRNRNTNLVYQFDPADNSYVTQIGNSGTTSPRGLSWAASRSEMWIGYHSTVAVLAMAVNGTISINTPGPFQYEFGTVGASFSGDLSGSSLSQTVVGLRGRSVNNTVPATGALFGWNGTSWGATAAGAVNGRVLYHNGTTWAWAAPAGDLSGTFPTLTVAKINGGTVPSSPVAGDVGKFLKVTAANTYGLVKSDTGIIPFQGGVSTTGNAFAGKKRYSIMKFDTSWVLGLSSTSTITFHAILETSLGTNAVSVQLNQITGTGSPQVIVGGSTVSTTATDLSLDMSAFFRPGGGVVTGLYQVDFYLATNDGTTVATISGAWIEIIP